MEVTNARFRHLEVVTTPEEYALLGRDVLNNFYVQLNGPRLDLPHEHLAIGEREMSKVTHVLCLHVSRRL